MINSTLNPGATKSFARKTAPRFLLALAMTGLIGLTGCGSKGERQYPTTSTDGAGRTNPAPDPNAKRDTIFGEDGLSIFGGGSDNKNQGGIGVNSFLWRASLDTISFMPLVSADPFGGVIITDWYQDPKAPGERFKLTVYILDKSLRADGVKVAAFRQVKGEGNSWTDAAVEPDTGTKIENAILVRARQLRISTIESDGQK